jgi:putative transposase
VTARVPSARTIIDGQLTDALRDAIGMPEGMCGRMMTGYLRRQGYRVAACTVDSLMGSEGLSGVVRGRQTPHHRSWRSKDPRRAPDLA